MIVTLHNLLMIYLLPVHGKDLECANKSLLKCTQHITKLRTCKRLGCNNMMKKWTMKNLGTISKVISQ